MTINEPPNQLEWSIRAHSGVDSGQWDWGIKQFSDTKLQITLIKIPATTDSHSSHKSHKGICCFRNRDHLLNQNSVTCKVGPSSGNYASRNV